MGFLDKLLGRNKAVAGEVADKSKELAGDVKDKTEDVIGSQRGEPEQGHDGSHNDHTHEPPSGAAT
jgi:hypothetical protein